MIESYLAIMFFGLIGGLILGLILGLNKELWCEKE